MTIPQDWRTPWRSPRWAFVAVWLVFLIYPIVSIGTSDHGLLVKIVGFALVAAFAVIYVLVSVYVTAWPQPRTPRWVGIAAFVVLTALGAGLVPIVGGNVVGMSPYLMAIAVFTFPIVPTIAIVVGLVVVATLMTELSPPWKVDPGTVVILITVGTTLLILRVLRGREEEREAAEKRRQRTDAQLAVVAERERVARDVHDILGHSLTVITVKSELAQRLIDIDPDRARTEMAELNQLSREALAQVRSTVGNLRSPDLASTLAAAQTALDAAGIAADLPDRTAEMGDAAGDPDGADPDRAVLAWVLREAITNVVRHSGATACTVTLDDTGITVHDNGHGMSTVSFGNGLRGLAERVESAGGALTVASDDSGTTVRAVL